MIEELHLLLLTRKFIRGIYDSSKFAVHWNFLRGIWTNSGGVLKKGFPLKSFEMRNGRFNFSSLTKLKVFASDQMFVKVWFRLVCSRPRRSFSYLFLFVWVMKSVIISNFTSFWKSFQWDVSCACDFLFDFDFVVVKRFRVHVRVWICCRSSSCFWFEVLWKFPFFSKLSLQRIVLLDCFVNMRVVFGERRRVLPNNVLNQCFAHVRSLHSLPHAKGHWCFSKLGFFSPELRQIVVSRTCLIMITSQFCLV